MNRRFQFQNYCQLISYINYKNECLNENDIEWHVFKGGEKNSIQVFFLKRNHSPGT